MNSYGVRCVFELPTEAKVTGTCLYEERITVWRANDVDEAIDMAEAEASSYCRENEGFHFTGLSQAFWMFTPVDINGVEVFSLLRESDLEQDEYIDQYFSTGGERQQISRGRSD